MNDIVGDNRILEFLPCPDAALNALSDIYQEAGLNEEDARKSALADLEQTFGPLTECAA